LGNLLQRHVTRVIDWGTCHEKSLKQMQ